MKIALDWSTSNSLVSLVCEGEPFLLHFSSRNLLTFLSWNIARWCARCKDYSFMSFIIKYEILLSWECWEANDHHLNDCNSFFFLYVMHFQTNYGMTTNIGNELINCFRKHREDLLNRKRQYRRLMQQKKHLLKGGSDVLTSHYYHHSNRLNFHVLILANDWEDNF